MWQGWLTGTIHGSAEQSGSPKAATKVALKQTTVNIGISLANFIE
jgi:hypothetical protein